MRKWHVSRQETAEQIARLIDMGVRDEEILGTVAALCKDVIVWSGPPEPQNTNKLTREDFLPPAAPIPLDRAGPEEADALIKAMVGYLVRVFEAGTDDMSVVQLANHTMDVLFGRNRNDA